MFDKILAIILLPALILFYFLEIIYRDFLEKEFPIEGLGILFFGVPFSLVTWVVIIYELRIHLHITLT